MIPNGRHLTDGEAADLVLGCGSASSRARLLAHAAACPECESLLRAHAAAHDRARLRLREGLPAKSRAWWREAFSPRLLAAAAALLAVATVPWLLRGPQHEAAAPWLTTGRGAIRRDAAADPHLVAGIEAYSRHDLATAHRELEAAESGGGAEAARRLYLASTVLAEGNAGYAIELLQPVRFEIDVPEPWRTEGYRTLEAAYRRAGLTLQADSVAAVAHAEEERHQP